MSNSHFAYSKSGHSEEDPVYVLTAEFESFLRSPETS